jgi:hypothetical protein
MTQKVVIKAAGNAAAVSEEGASFVCGVRDAKEKKGWKKWRGCIVP